MPLFGVDVKSPDDVFDLVVGLPDNVLGYETTSDGVLVVLVLDVIFT